MTLPHVDPRQHWWRERLERLRKHPPGGRGDGGVLAYDVCVRELTSAMRQRVRHRFGGYERVLGPEFDDVFDRVWLAHGDTPETWGLLQFLEHTEELPQAPLAWCLRRFGWRIEQERRRRVRQLQLGDGPDGDEPWPDHVAGGAEPDADVRAIPSAVAHMLEDAHRLLAVALRLAPALASASQQTLQSLRTSANNWHLASQHLRRDVTLNERRLRWVHVAKGEVPIPRVDASGRAWQAKFYGYEGAHAWTAPDEEPADKHAPPGQAFDRHLWQFRKWYAEADACGVVSAAAGTAEPTGAFRLLAWDPPVHPTLLANKIAE